MGAINWRLGVGIDRQQAGSYMGESRICRSELARDPGVSFDGSHAPAWEPQPHRSALSDAEHRKLRAHAGAWARSAGGSAWGLIASKLAPTWARAGSVGASLLAIRA